MNSVEHFHDLLSRRNATVVTGIAALLVGITSGVAVAAVIDNFNPNSHYSQACYSTTATIGFPCQTENAALSYYMDSAGDYNLESADDLAVTTTMDNDYHPTHLNTGYDSTPVFSGSGETDMIYQEGSAGIPSSKDGIYWCNGEGTGFKCDQGYVRIRGGGFYTRGLACHETGHGVGLMHGQSATPYVNNDDPRLGCLRTPVGSNTALGTNNFDNINDWY